MYRKLLRSWGKNAMDMYYKQGAPMELEPNDNGL
jgi:hypothetical protein